MKQRHSDVIVVGGGHAGCEAAQAAYRMGARTTLVTHRLDRLGEMSCNPAIGGLGKGHLVREIDALDGLMGRAADEAGIQFRLLNRSKGPAVQGPRVQADRSLYRQAVQAEFAARPDLSVIASEVVDLLIANGRVTGVVLADSTEVSAEAVVLTTGTFLRGMIHMGETQTPAGRLGDPASVRLAARIADLGLALGRLKTGTPPRLARSSIDWDALTQQPGDNLPMMMSFLSTAPSARQVSCAITHTNANTHEVVRANIGRSAMYSGKVEGAGPRYCPSIEDKVMRFADKTSHQVFLEPEGLTSQVVYPNGLSTSLPHDVQVEYVRTIDGLQVAEIVQPGYAIEYDFIDPRCLDVTLQTKALERLFLAGQINGTTGYEEAAAQGLVAGLNAAAAATGRAPIVFGRAEAYLGVLIDDLVTQGVTEPYRMFTSRAEYRLHLRADNADQRLTPRGIELGCVGPVRQRAFEARAEALAKARAVADRLTLSPGEARSVGLPAATDGVRRSLFDLMSAAECEVERLVAGLSGLSATPADMLAQIARDARYAPYLERQARDVAALRRDEQIELPAGLAFDALPGLSAELRQKLCRVDPRTLAQAARIEGMTPAALTLLLLKARAIGRARRAG